jgi:hypothetical protein
MSQRGGNHHYYHQQTERSKDGVSGSGGGGGGHSIKIHNFISTDALYDGEQERRVHYNGVTAKETAVTTGAAANSTRFVIFFVLGNINFNREVFAPEWRVLRLPMKETASRYGG